MAIKVADAAMAAKKYVTNAQAGAPAYAAGVATAGPLWAAQTVAAEDTWGQGVQAAVANNRFSKGVQKAGPAKYQNNSAGKGAQRYPQGVQQAGPTWAQNTQPYLQVIAGINLPPRQPTGSPANYLRSQAVGQALRQAKLSS